MPDKPVELSGVKLQLAPEAIKFKYNNWHSEDHEYVVRVESIEYGRYDKGGHTGSIGNMNWVLHAEVVTRDGDLREDMSPRRRTFLLSGIRDAEQVYA